MKTRLSVSEAKAEEPTSYNVCFQALGLDGSSASASDSGNLVFSRSYHSTLLITTPTKTSSVTKISLNCSAINMGVAWMLYLS